MSNLLPYVSSIMMALLRLGPRARSWNLPKHNLKPWEPVSVQICQATELVQRDEQLTVTVRFKYYDGVATFGPRARSWNLPKHNLKPWEPVSVQIRQAPELVQRDEQLAATVRFKYYDGVVTSGPRVRSWNLPKHNLIPWYEPVSVQIRQTTELVQRDEQLAVTVRILSYRGTIKSKIGYTPSYKSKARVYGELWRAPLPCFCQSRSPIAILWPARCGQCYLCSITSYVESVCPRK
eukprot:284819277_4